MNSVAAGLLSVMVFVGLGAVWLAIRSGTVTDWLSGIGLLLVAGVLSTLIAQVRHLGETKANKITGT